MFSANPCLLLVIKIALKMLDRITFLKSHLVTPLRKLFLKRLLQAFYHTRTEHLSLIYYTCRFWPPSSVFYQLCPGRIIQITVFLELINI